MQKAILILFFTGIVACLLQIWLPAYYLTGDGPCHVYNAKILHDLWTGTDADFYGRFYTLSTVPNPNWFTHILLAILMFVANGVVSEKILLSMYVVIFCTGFYKLLHIFKGEHSWLVLLGFLFVFNQPLSKGFYNFAISTALFFWVAWGYLYFLQRRTTGSFILLSLLTTLTFFAHPIGFIISCITTWSMLAVSILKSSPRKSSNIAIQILLLSLSQLPSVLLLLKFVNNQGGSVANIHFQKDRIDDLRHFINLVTHNHHEEVFASTAAAILLILFFITIMGYATRHRKLTYSDSLLVPILFTIIIYFTFPDWLLGGGLLLMRMQVFFFILVAAYVATGWLRSIMAGVGGVLSFMIFIGISCVRAESIRRASDGVSDYLSVYQHLKPYSIVLPLNFAPNGKTESGAMITDRNWIFTHAQEYNGTLMPLIMLDNYEANTGYFPLKWNEKVNPFSHLSKEEGIETAPPYAAIDDYKKDAGIRIDNIVMWGYDTSFLNKGHMPQLMQQINASYTITYISKTGRTILYTHK